ncbi:MAG TPA: hypothetical protein DCP28_01360 [Cytophagales bacterium]|nr:hypothetical protein [Cytophagales bacterium]
MNQEKSGDLNVWYRPLEILRTKMRKAVENRMRMISQTELRVISKCISAANIGFPSLNTSWGQPALRLTRFYHKKQIPFPHSTFIRVKFTPVRVKNKIWN